MVTDYQEYPQGLPKMATFYLLAQVKSYLIIPQMVSIGVMVGQAQHN